MIICAGVVTPERFHRGSSQNLSEFPIEAFGTDRLLEKSVDTKLLDAALTVRRPID
jgi:hypothetical protein